MDMSINLQKTFSHHFRVRLVPKDNNLGVDRHPCFDYNLRSLQGMEFSVKLDLCKSYQYTKDDFFLGMSASNS